MISLMDTRFIILSIIFQSAAGLISKFTANGLNRAGSPGFALISLFLAVLLCLYLQAISWQRVLARYPLSIAYPCMSLVNFIVLFSANLLFSEAILWNNILGLVLISAGIFTLFRGS
jgi:multidrug transporter EmrE-like cation transporter